MPRPQINMSFNFNLSPSAWQDPPSVQHPFIDCVREAVSKYRLQSAAHFNVSIDVCQATHAENPDRFADVDRDFELCVGFYNFSANPIIAACRPKTQFRGQSKEEVIKAQVQVWMGNKFVSLTRFLSMKFPTYDGPVSDDTMFQWWNANGKTSRWTKLSTEEKERIIQFCMHRSPPPPVLRNPRARTRARGRTVQGAPEVAGQLGEWASLLAVSHQVRAISLRLCFAGTSDMTFNNGLCIIVNDFFRFKNSIRRLGKHRQMIEANGIPTDDKTWELEKTYKAFPKIYPHLEQYATFQQGIRKIELQFSFMDAFYFFKITAGSFAQHWKAKPHYMDFEVFEQLPHLNELIIKLPDLYGHSEDAPRQPIRMFYGYPYNCPRTLHRLIYEKAAEVLAHYKNVKMCGFIDEEEEERFLKIREVAKKNLKITMEELEELYKDNKGGIELEESVVPGLEKKEMDQEERFVVFDNFWPPKCRCETLCCEVLYPSSG
jgi:hypothetical protein